MERPGAGGAAPEVGQVKREQAVEALEALGHARGLEQALLLGRREEQRVAERVDEAGVVDSREQVRGYAASALRVRAFHELPHPSDDLLAKLGDALTRLLRVRVLEPLDLRDPVEARRSGIMIMTVSVMMVTQMMTTMAVMTILMMIR